MLNKALQVMKSLDYGQDVTLLSAIMEESIAEANGDAAATKRIEQGLLRILRDDKASVNGKDFACRQLKIVATKDSIDTLSKMLADEKHAHMARYVLQAMPDASASKALLDALGSTSGKLKAGVIGSLGVRQEAGAVAPLAALLSDSDATVAQAAAQALGAIRSKEAGKALLAAKPNSAAVAHAADAAFACAESMLASGDKAGALMMYKTLAKGTPAKHVKLAATRGMLACARK